jgi:hypothetical protein
MVYKKFPEIPEGKGWGAKGELDLDYIARWRNKRWTRGGTLMYNISMQTPEQQPPGGMASPS